MLVQIQQTKVLAGDGTQTDLTPQAPNLISVNIDVYPIQNLAPSLPPPQLRVMVLYTRELEYDSSILDLPIFLMTG